MYIISNLNFQAEFKDH